MPHVINFSTEGVVRSMHNDRFSLGFLGDQAITRASDIRWSVEDQSWGIWFAVKKEGHEPEFIYPYRTYRGFDSYDAAREFEVQVMNEAMLRRLPPTNLDILQWAVSARGQKEKSE